MAVHRVTFRIDLDPSTPGMSGAASKIESRLLEAVDLATTGETSQAVTNVVTSGNPANRVAYFEGDLIFATREPVDDILADLFDETGTFLWPDRIIPTPPTADPADWSGQFIFAQTCYHDQPHPDPCDVDYEWREQAP